MLLKLLKLVGYLMLIAFFVVTLAFTSRESRNITCSSIQIKFSDADIIRIGKADIDKLVRDADEQLIGKELKSVNAYLIEEAVEKHKAILNAEVYKIIAKDSTSYTGILGVRIRHRVPVVRILSSAGNFYLDESGEQVPVSSQYTANVLVATGHFSEEFAKQELLPFILYLKNNPFWMAQTEQVHVEKNGEIVLIPLVGNHYIELGTLEDYPDKLNNMKAFYEQVMVRNNWDKYGSISVKYKNQVVAKKK